MPNVPKQLKDLNLLDRFLFAEAMDDPENMKTLLDIILGQDTILKYLPQTEKESRTSPMNRFIKLDVYALDEYDSVYNSVSVQGDTRSEKGKSVRLLRYFPSAYVPVRIHQVPCRSTDYSFSDSSTSAVEICSFF